VVLKNRPIWMSDFLADTIATSVRPDVARSPLDHKLLVEAVDALQSNPWIKTVNQVRRAYDRAPGDTIEVDCEYRAPVALVKHDGLFTFVDEAGTILPDRFTADQLSRLIYGSQGKTEIRIIDGVKQRPTSAGQHWPGDDLTAGLELVRLLAHQPFADEILKVDVSNYHGRQDPAAAHIVLVTKYLTEIRWGRNPSATDKFVEAAPEVKLAHMAEIFRQFKQIDAHQPWLDLRFDHVIYPMRDSVSAHVDQN